MSVSTKKKQAEPKVAPKATPTTEQPQQQQTPMKDFFATLGKKAPLFALAVVFLIAFFVYKDYLLFERAFFFKDIGSDSYNYSYPYLYHVADYIANYGVPKWSFSLGMGQSLFPFFLRDPFDIFLFLAGKDRIMFGMVYVELAKILLSGLTFYYYLKTLKLSNFTAITGAMMFAFCGFMVVGGGWYFFSYETFNLALLLLGFEQLFSQKKWAWFTAAIFLICVSQPFNLYVYGLFLAVYAVFRSLQQPEFSAKELGMLFVKMIGFGLLGMLISSPFLIENIVQIMESPRGSGSTSYTQILSSKPMFETADKTQFGSAVLRLFSSDMLGTGSEFRGWMNYLESPMFYCGLPCLLLVPQVFQFLDRRKKVIFGVFLAIWVLPVIFPWFRYAFWLFSGDYYRGYSVILSVVFLYYAANALEMIVEKKKINLIVLIATLVLLFALINYPYFDENLLNPSVSVFVSFILVVYAVLLFFIGKQSDSTLLKYVFFIAVIFELSYLSGKSVNDRDAITPAELAQRVGYNDYTVDAVKSFQNDKSFYRIDKTYFSSPAIHASLNDAMVQGYRGTSAYNPFNQVYYIYYLQLMGISEKGNELQSRWASGLASRPILESANQVKYMLAKKEMNPLWRATGDSIANYGDVRVFRNKYRLPLGYSYDRYIAQSVFEPLSNLQKDFITLSACVVKDEDVNKLTGMKPFELKDTVSPNNFSFDLYAQRVADLSRDTLTLDKMTETHISGKVNASDSKMLYLSVPYDKGWQLKVDGQVRDKHIVFAGMTGVFLTRGQHTIELVYDLRYFNKGLILGLVGIIIFVAVWLYESRSKKKSATDAQPV